MAVVACEPVTRYRVWDPTARQEIEPDTTYLMDLGVEAALGTARQGMIGRKERDGGPTYAPPWRGGTKAAVVPGKYRDGLKALTSDEGYVLMPLDGLVAVDQGTFEFFVMSDVPWASLGESMALRVYAEFLQYLRVTINAGVVKPWFRHDHSPTAFVTQQFTVAHAAAADVWVSLALTLLAGVLKLYINGTLAGQVAGCTPPAFWSDAMSAAGGVAVSAADPSAADSTHLSVSDLRISTLARVPGQVPAP